VRGERESLQLAAATPKGARIMAKDAHLVEAALDTERTPLLRPRVGKR
jgi:hypothetical protein